MSFFHFESRHSPQILTGDCLEILKTLASESIDCCVTSPPYYGLRDYGTAAWEGGDATCRHRVGSQVTDSKAPGAIVSGMRPGADTSCCLDCGAIRIDQQIGIELTPELYVTKIVAVFEEIRRVLKNTGTLWLNLGDSYSNDDKWGGVSGGKHVKNLHGATGIGRSKVHTGLKPKDLIGIPWECAFALRAAGWYLRSDIIWQKENVMPESIKDRPTKSHEYVFLFSKSKLYYYDADAVAEPSVGGHVRGPALHPDASTNGNGGLARRPNAPTRNRRTVWSINTKPFREAHFATMPPDLAALCIAAGSSEHGCCPACGKPWRRLVERTDQGHDGSRYGERAVAATGGALDGGTAKSTLGSSHGALTGQRVLRGWEPSCACQEQPPVPSVVLDPFGGAGTTGLVAQRLGRRSMLIELNPEYAKIARERIDQD